ncbi:ADAMTS-like protein 4 isoform X2 [Venturia canescens]|uniref:ADAMTS-like protein 4 isoform X2 n=1 Tax=Venturia canescens TaxID=32260 RepID=UPI001C9CC8EF|nr:ADAMTS-like protein 4 isoform X2 [Venturia canescens]
MTLIILIKCLIAILALFSTLSCAHAHLPDKYPIEVYHMLQERTQYGIGSDNRVKGSWGPWSSWSECSRSCGTGIQSQARECVPARESRRKRSPFSPGSVNATNLERAICIGTYKRYHVCNTQECNEFPDDPRAEQCARYNNRIYKGQSYLWVPFLNAPNPCALNCRAVGQRFYATLEPAVIDGTPCDGPNLRGHSTGIALDKTEQWLCVAGQCRPVGCDGVVGSGATRDTCGICGGVGKSCKLYEGIFMEPILAKGHQPVTTIPRGAMSLNISELRSSANYLALRTENGSYVLNGPWSVSPSGTYKAAGTSITYQRGDRTRMESILAAGPLNESLKLEISYHELNPGVLYKYMLPLTEEPDDGATIAPPLRAIGSSERGNEIPDTDTRLVPAPNARRSYKALEASPDKRRRIQTSVEKPNRKKEDMKYSPTTVMAGDAPKANTSENKKRNRKGRKKFIWRVMGTSPCSKTCGGGLQTSILKCVRLAKGIPANERRCRNIEKPRIPPPLRCNDRPCPARWKAKPWSDCSVTCGTGTKTRKLECVQELNAKLTMRVAAGACVQPPDLRTVESCTRQACPNVSIPEVRSLQMESPPWETGPWSSCSTSCGRGIKTRRVTCAGEKCFPTEKPETEQDCEIQSCDSKDEKSNHVWMYSEWSSKCSARCGNGSVTRHLVCSHTNEILCNSKPKPEVRRDCTSNESSCGAAEWFAGPWSPCAVSCGSGEQVRDVICVKKIGNESRIVSDENCVSTRPEISKICKMPDCSAEWFTSDWSECTAKCGGGTRNRLVRCTLEKAMATTCEKEKKPADTQRCNLEACRNKSHHVASRVPKKVHATGKCVDDYPNCKLVVKTGLCRIKYYKHSCCGCRE